MISESNDSTVVAEALVSAEAFGIEQILASPNLMPRQKGLYSWWMTPGSIPGLSGLAHPIRPDLQLLYVGIASKPASDLRKRLTTHIGGTSRRSTQRLSLAAVLADQYGWSATMVSGRPALAPEFEAQLSSFMAKHLTVSWLIHGQPESVETAVIQRLMPPLNLDGNSRHPSYFYVKEKRAAFRSSVL
jgi:hypothetical protein